MRLSSPGVTKFELADSCGPAQWGLEQAGAGGSGPALRQIPERLPGGQEPGWAGLHPPTPCAGSAAASDPCPAPHRPRRLGVRLGACACMLPGGWGQELSLFQPIPGYNYLGFTARSLDSRRACRPKARLGMANGARRDCRPPCALPRSPPSPLPRGSRGRGPMTSWNCRRI